MASPTFRIALVGAAVLATGACRQVVAPPSPGAPPFPPTLETEITTASGLVFRAAGEVVSTGPTTLRITGTVTNPTGADIVANTLAGDCQFIVAATWESSPFVRVVQPLDGGGFTGSVLGACGSQTTTRLIAAGETIQLSKSTDLVLSELFNNFVPGRYVISAVFVDEFIYEVFAIDTQVAD